MTSIIPWPVHTAKPQDFSTIADILNDSILHSTASFESNPKTAEDIAQLTLYLDKQDLPLFVIRDSETINPRVLGFGYYRQFRANSGYRFCFEHSVYVNNTAKGLGLGRALLCAMETHACQYKKAHVMIGGISADNIESIEFHRRCGYKETARLPQVGFKNNRFVDLVIMQKIFLLGR